MSRGRRGRAGCLPGLPAVVFKTEAGRAPWASRPVMTMAARKTSRKSAGKAAKRATTTRPAARKSARKAAPRTERKIRPGFITHTELVSSDPAATKTWAVKAFGWKFGDSMPMPDGSTYHMWQFGEDQGGGIRPPSGPEGPGTVPYVEVPDIKAAHAKALQAGATEMMPPTAIPGSGGWISVVQAPGGPAIGLWGTK